ncbi:MAG: aminodeoxychorismate/anthranilate synthase component II [Bacteroidota bacterium]
MILILDNYDSFTYNLVHLVARHTDQYEVVRNDALTLDEVRERAYDAVLISPGPGRPEDAGLSEPIIRELGATTPILGVCLGHQAIGRVFGGTVTYAPTLMHGKTSDVSHDNQGVFAGVAQPCTATRYHSLVVAREGLPDCFAVSAETADGTIMGLRHKSFPIEGIQFHPESVLTTEGPKMIANWLRDCGLIATDASTTHESTQP